jgi:hypothetical protein
MIKIRNGLIGLGIAVFVAGCSVTPQTLEERMAEQEGWFDLKFYRSWNVGYKLMRRFKPREQQVLVDENSDNAITKGVTADAVQAAVMGDFNPDMLLGGLVVSMVNSISNEGRAAHNKKNAIFNFNQSALYMYQKSKLTTAESILPFMDEVFGELSKLGFECNLNGYTEEWQYGIASIAINPGEAGNIDFFCKDPLMNVWVLNGSLVTEVKNGGTLRYAELVFQNDAFLQEHNHNWMTKLRPALLPDYIVIQNGYNPDNDFKWQSRLYDRQDVYPLKVIANAQTAPAWEKHHANKINEIRALKKGVQ